VEQAVDVRVRFAVESTVETIRFAVVERVVGPNRRSVPRVGPTISRSAYSLQNVLFTYSEGVGLVVGFVSPWIFGVALPLVD
jgi:hypothetical protein